MHQNTIVLEHKKRGRDSIALASKPAHASHPALLPHQPMARSGVLKTQMFFLREAKPARRGVSKVAGAEWAPGKGRGKADVGDHKGDGSSSSWVPHPRTGIYFPKGHDHVMEDVPVGAASFGQTYWFRTEDGVDKPDPDVSTPY